MRLHITLGTRVKTGVQLFPDGCTPFEVLLDYFGDITRGDSIVPSIIGRDDNCGARTALTLTLTG